MGGLHLHPVCAVSSLQDWHAKTCTYSYVPFKNLVSIELKKYFYECFRPRS